jgi:hypothetical protein
LVLRRCHKVYDQKIYPNRKHELLNYSHNLAIWGDKYKPYINDRGKKKGYTNIRTQGHASIKFDEDSAPIFGGSETGWKLWWEYFCEVSALSQSGCE